MERAKFDGIELEYVAKGSGEPVVLIHGGVVAQYLSPLLAEPELTRQYRMISYHRRGYAGSTHQSGPFSIKQQAQDCRKLVDYLGIEKAHIVGHSYGANIGMQLALDNPECIRSLSLLEGGVPLALASSASSGPQSFQGMEQATQIYMKGDKAGGVDAFLNFVSGLPNYRTLFEETRPGAFDQALADADTFFGIELPALFEWNFTSEESRRIKLPIVSVIGTESFIAPVAKELEGVFRQWLPQGEVVWIPNATHAFLETNKKGLVDCLAEFFARHPLEVLA